jgi:hypothetical protein
MLKNLICLAVLFPLPVIAQELRPQQIMDRFFNAHRDLRFLDMAPYVHSKTLKIYRSTTGAIIRHAVDEFGIEAVTEFFQGTSPQELERFSDREYWAFVTASSAQFSVDKPVPVLAPIAELKEGADRILLVFPAQRRLVTAPEMGVFGGHNVYIFEQEDGAWKLISFFPQTFESTIYSYLRQKRSIN